MVILVFFLPSLPLFFLPSRAQAFYLGGRQGCFVFSPLLERKERKGKGGEERKKGEVETKHRVKTQKVENASEMTATSQRLLSS